MANLIFSLALTDLTERTFITGLMKVIKVKSLEIRKNAAWKMLICV
jgi:hypothetical protein